MHAVYLESLLYALRAKLEKGRKTNYKFGASADKNKHGLPHSLSYVLGGIIGGLQVRKLGLYLYYLSLIIYTQ